eukprot:TRINITY_DN10984_c0_g1_i1.p1 TRINITY_DN10984_c0_g1~~TRINITY_DN10984_c0_g1_i1.p1  ORF type:complete len:184 (+),score=43.16 TRINITY_DN10984_c0_g1_i1:158-709(+)
MTSQMNAADQTNAVATAIPQEDDEQEWAVSLHIYDLSNGMAAMFSRQFVGKQIDGIWHTGIVVYGKEYYFGGGIQCDNPSQTPYGTPVKTLSLGKTAVPPEVFIDALEGFRDRFNMNSYDIIHNNCNNFTNEMAQFLVGSSIPSEITSLPTDFLETPMGRMLQPMLQSMQNSMIQARQPPPPR